MTSDDRGIQPVLEHVHPQLPGLIPGDAEEGIWVLCVSEDTSSAEREVMPILKRAGLRVDLVAASLQQLPGVSHRPYQLVLFDISLPDGPGYKVCEQVRSACKAPVMLVLHGAARNDVLRGYQLGADAYILAPFDERELLARLGALLRRQPARWRTV